MRQTGGLFRDRTGYRGVRMPETAHGDTGQSIEVLLAVRVFEVDAVAAGERDRQAFVGFHQVVHV